MDAAANEKPPLVNLTIDGRPVSAPKGTNLIEAARPVGVRIPHFCYHRKLSVAGNCRMCLVEIGMPKMGPDRKPVLKPDGTPEIAWNPKPQIGCATTVSEGMSVRTNSKLVEECQHGVMEFLLINHPLDCPICDQAGECKLQEQSAQYGAGQSRFVEEKERKPKKTRLGPRVMLDDERCILCSRCIRFCREIAGDDVLGFLQRGSHSYVGCYPGRQLENNYSLNTVDICPVGALTSIDFRFKMRVWFLKETRSICASCATGCNIVVGSREGVVYRYVPRRNNAVNSDWMCDAGRLNYRWINDSERLRTPMLLAEGGTRVGGKLTPADWAMALSFADNRMAANRGRVAILASARCSTEELYLLKKLAAAYEARATDIVSRAGDADHLLVHADKNPNTPGARLMGLAAATPGDGIPRIRQGIENGEIRVLLTVRECAIEAGIPVSTLEKLDTLVAVDILPSATANHASVVLAGATHVEKCGTFINARNRLQRFHAAFPPAGDARADWEILRDLLPPDQRAAFGTFEQLFRKMCEETPALRGATWEKIGDQGMEVAI
jgi:NADH-quinone oxidoreductase subunit G